MLDGNTDIDKVTSIYAGKFRRYHNESWLRRFIDIKTNLLNLRDAVFVVVGFFQSLRLLRKYRPQAVFLKGGFVGVPVGLAAGARRLPIITHDSDAVAGLANRLVSRLTLLHTTALPADYYSYPKNKVKQVGVIVAQKYQPVSEAGVIEAKQEIGIPKDATLLLITGGSTGAIAVNEAIERLYKELFAKYSNLYIIHQTGKGKAGEPSKYADYSRLQRIELLKDMHLYSAAADIIVMRAGANTLAEFAMQAKACIVIPSPHLPGGHQLLNAAYFQERDAAVVLDQAEIEMSPQLLSSHIATLIKDKQRREQIAKNMHKEAQRNAGQLLSDEIYQLASDRSSDASKK